jgi:hypothetical protein
MSCHFSGIAEEGLMVRSRRVTMKTVARTKTRRAKFSSSDI